MKSKAAKNPKIDAVQMMRDIRSSIYEETKGMTFEERQAYYGKKDVAEPNVSKKKAKH